MKYNNLFNVKKLIHKSLLDEKYLPSEFKWGFELEGFIDCRNSYGRVLLSKLHNDKNMYEKQMYKITSKLEIIEDESENIELTTQLNNLDEDLKNVETIINLIEDYDEWWDEPSDEITYKLSDLENDVLLSAYDDFSYKEKQNLNEYLNSNLGEGEIKYDGSLESSVMFSVPFEWASPVLEFKPSVIQKVLKVLSTIYESHNVYVNDTCGFHIHLSYPDISRDDMIWLMCKFALDDNIQELVSGTEFADFYGDYYATNDWINDVRNFLQQGFIGRAVKYLPMEKQDSFLIHKQGTLEWRGPRNFLVREYNYEYDIDSYVINENLIEVIKILWKFVDWISKTLREDSIDIKGNMSKKEFLDKVKKISGYFYNDIFKSNSREYKNNKSYQAFYASRDVSKLAHLWLRTLNMDIIRNLEVYQYDGFAHIIMNYLDRTSKPNFGHSDEEIKNAIEQIKEVNSELYAIIRILTR